MSRNRRSRGRRYEEPHLNIKKVIIVLLIFAICIFAVMFIVSRLSDNKGEKNKITSKDYFAVYKDNKWGIIDSKGETVIEPSYAEMITIPNSKKDVFLCIYDVDYNTGKYKTKALNSKNEEIFKEYEQIEAIQNKDKNNNSWYEEDVLKVETNNKYGIIDFTGKILADCQYDEISALEGIKNSLKVKKDDKYGIMDNEGKQILQPVYISITNLGEDNKSGFIVKKDNDNYGIVDYSGNKILATNYEKIEKIYGNDQYVVEKEGKQILVKKDGQEVLTEGFDEIKHIMKSTENGVIFVKDDKYGVMNLEGQTTIEAKYDELKETKTGILIAKQNGKYGVINLQEEQKIPFEYASILYNEKADIYITETEELENKILNSDFEVKQTGLLLDLDSNKGYFSIKQSGETKYYNFKFEEKNAKDIFSSNTLFLTKKDGKFGYVDKDGKTVVDCIYDDAMNQNSYGYCAVKKDGRWGSIDENGNVVQEPAYKLENYLKIDFIGRWHGGVDPNISYYTVEE